MADPVSQMMRESRAEVSRYLGTLGVRVNDRAVQNLHNGMLNQYQNICGEVVVTHSPAGDGYTLNDNAYNRFFSAIRTFFSGPGRLMESEARIGVGVPLIEKIFEGSLANGRMCPEGSPVKTVYNLTTAFSYYRVLFDFQAAVLIAQSGHPRTPRALQIELQGKARILSEAIDQTKLILTGLQRGFFRSDEELELLKNLNIILSHTSGRFFGASLLNLMRWEQYQDPASGQVEQIPRIRPNYLEMVERAVTFIPDWRSHLHSVVRRLSRNEIINEDDWNWELSLIDGANEGTESENPVINSLLVIMMNGLGFLARKFMDIFDANKWSQPSTLDALLHVLASQHVDYERVSLVDMAVDMVEDPDFQENGTHPIPNRIAAFLSYPQFHDPTLTRVAELIRKLMNSSATGSFLRSGAGRTTVYTILDNLVRTYFNFVREEKSPEEVNQIMPTLVITDLLRIAGDQSMTEARGGLILEALNSEGSPYYMKPLHDRAAQGMLNDPAITMQEFLDVYYRDGGIGGSGSAGGGSSSSGTGGISMSSDYSYAGEMDLFGYVQGPVSYDYWIEAAIMQDAYRQRELFIGTLSRRSVFFEHAVP